MAATNAKANPESSEPTNHFDRKELSRLFARLRHEMGGLVDDAGRKRPFYARSKEEAVAKRDAAVRVLSEFADRIDVLKKQE